MPAGNSDYGRTDTRSRDLIAFNRHGLFRQTVSFASIPYIIALRGVFPGESDPLNGRAYFNMSSFSPVENICYALDDQKIKLNLVLNIAAHTTTQTVTNR